VPSKEKERGDQKVEEAFPFGYKLCKWVEFDC